MIVLGNIEFAIAMKFCGIKDSHIVTTREQCLKIIKITDKEEFILANASVIDLVPELHEFPNLASLPDNVSEFEKIDDLKHIIKSAVGFDIGGI